MVCLLDCWRAKIIKSGTIHSGQPLFFLGLLFEQLPGRALLLPAAAGRSGEDAGQRRCLPFRQNYHPLLREEQGWKDLTERTQGVGFKVLFFYGTSRVLLLIVCCVALYVWKGYLALDRVCLFVDADANKSESWLLLKFSDKHLLHENAKQLLPILL
jgi:hypothetical protein